MVRLAPCTGLGWDIHTGLGKGSTPGFPHIEGLLLATWTATSPGYSPGSLSSCLCLPPPPRHSVCQGRQWHCTSHRCGGWCQASGAPHYVTFDGLAFTFPGACEYLLVREASGRFTVSAQNLPCGASGLTCTKALTVQLQSTAVHMLRGGHHVEGWHCQGGGARRLASHFCRGPRPGVPHCSPSVQWGGCLSSLLLVGNPNSGRLQQIKAQRGLMT